MSAGLQSTRAVLLYVWATSGVPGRFGTASGGAFRKYAITILIDFLFHFLKHRIENNLISTLNFMKLGRNGIIPQFQKIRALHEQGS